MIDRDRICRQLQNSDTYNQFVADCAAGKRPRAHVVQGFLLPITMTIIGGDAYLVYDKQQCDRTYPHGGERILSTAEVYERGAEVTERVVGKHPALGAPYGRDMFKALAGGKRITPEEVEGFVQAETCEAPVPRADFDNVIRELMESVSEASLLRREVYELRQKTGKVDLLRENNIALIRQRDALQAQLKSCEQVNLKLQQLVRQYRDEALIHPRTAAVINQAIGALQRALRGE